MVALIDHPAVIQVFLLARQMQILHIYLLNAAIVLILSLGDDIRLENRSFWCIHVVLVKSSRHGLQIWHARLLSIRFLVECKVHSFLLLAYGLLLFFFLLLFLSIVFFFIVVCILILILLLFSLFVLVFVEVFLVFILYQFLLRFACCG